MHVFSDSQGGPVWETKLTGEAIWGAHCWPAVWVRVGGHHRTGGGHWHFWEWRPARGSSESYQFIRLFKTFFSSEGCKHLQCVSIIPVLYSAVLSFSLPKISNLGKIGYKLLHILSEKTEVNVISTTHIYHYLSDSVN